MGEKKKGDSIPAAITVRETERVKRIDGTGCLGVVRELRQETAGTSTLVERSWLCQVLWDNGTLSYCEPDRLVKA
jgi:hypothetical protein